MAGKDTTSELSMENYFNEGLADRTEPNNPFEVAEQDPPKRGRPGKKRGGKKSGLKRVLIILAVAAALALALFLFIMISRLRNDGARYAKKLSERIGSQLKIAEKSADVTLKSESDYPTLKNLFSSYQAIAESKKSCRIEGVKLPQWAIFCNTDADDLTTVTYYNYKVLEKNIFGTERKSYIDPQLVSLGTSVADTEAKLELEPYRIQYLQGKNELREYRYCYEDKDSGDIVAYVITGIWDESGALTAIPDTRKNYIGSLLASPET